MRPIAIDGDANKRAVVVGDDDGTIEVDGVMEAEDGDNGRGALIDIVAARRDASEGAWLVLAQVGTIFIIVLTRYQYSRLQSS